jgi:hypothetical protein
MLTFAVTIPQPPGTSIKQTRELLIDAIEASRNSFRGDEENRVDNPLPIKVHLLNKETSYA